MKRFLFFYIFIVPALSLFAQPTTITWQGKLLDASGNAITQNDVALTFALFDASTGGNQLWPISGVVTKTVNVVQGLYAVQLGTGTGDDITFTAAMFNGKTPWLEVKVGTETLPRTEITNVPFALISNDLSAAGWENPGEIGKTTPNTGKFTSVEAGTLKITSGASTGKVLTSDTDGNASWTTPYTGLTNFTESNFTYDSRAGVKFTPDNAATDVDVVLQPKGAGAIAAQQPDGTTASGNNRGFHSTDMQRVRANATQVASGDYATIVGGYNNIASGLGSTAIGNTNIANNDYSTAIGVNSEASGVNSMAIGFRTISNANNTTAIGTYTTASGDYSTATGNRTTAPSAYETVTGRYNTTYTPSSTVDWNSTDRLFVVGNGTTNALRSNALTVLKNANTTIGGSLTINGNGTSTSYLFPESRGTSGQFLKTDGAGATSWSGVTKADVSLGNVENTALSTWTGSANMTTLGTITTGTWSGTAITVAKGGTGATTKTAGFDTLSPMTTQGDLIYGGVSGTGTRLAKGTTGQVLTMNSGATAPEWSTPANGTVTNVSGTAPVSVTTGTTTPVISISAATSTASGSMSASDKSKLDAIASGAQVNVNPDWNAATGDALILNKPNLATVATSGSYNDLSGKPTTDGSETKITAGTNVTVSGSGISANPYVINTIAKLTQAQRDALSPYEGLIVYNSTTKKPNYYSDTEWMNFDGTSAKTIAIGVSHQGGIITYIFQPGDPGYVAGQTHGLIVSAFDIAAAVSWGTNISVGAFGLVMGDGPAATRKIVDALGPGYYAAYVCDTLTLNGFTDWYLPARDELRQLYYNRYTVGGVDGGIYWTSLESSATFAYNTYFADPVNEYSMPKSTTRKVRAFRTF